MVGLFSVLDPGFEGSFSSYVLGLYRPHGVHRCGPLMHMFYVEWSVCVCMCVLGTKLCKKPRNG